MKENIKGYILGLLSITIVSLAIIVTKYFTIEIKFYDLIFWRMLIAFFTQIIVSFFFNENYDFFQKLNQEKNFFLASLFGLVIYFSFEYFALKYTHSSNVSFIISATPVFTLFADVIFRKRKFKNEEILGSLISLAGIGFLIFNNFNSINVNPLGSLFAILSMLSWVVYSFLLESLSKQYHYIYVTKKIFFYGMVMFFPIYIYKNLNFEFAFAISVKKIAFVLFLAVVSSSFAGSLKNKAISLIGVVKMNFFYYLMPVLTTIFSILFFNYQISFGLILGGSLVLLGLILIKD